MDIQKFHYILQFNVLESLSRYIIVKIQSEY